MPARLIAALALLASVLVLAACGETKDSESSSSSSSSKSSGAADPNATIKEGLKTVSIPKQLGNPYEEFEHSGVDEALTELKGSNTISGPTDAGASTQIPIINAAVQKSASMGLMPRKLNNIPNTVPATMTAYKPRASPGLRLRPDFQPITSATA